MDPKAAAVCDEICRKADAGAGVFAEATRNLSEVEIDHYEVDLQKATKTFYDIKGNAHVVHSLPVQAPVANRFDAGQIQSAFVAVQAKKVDYKQFCTLIMQAGTASYMTSLSGKHVAYKGLAGKQHIEWFPGAKP